MSAKQTYLLLYNSLCTLLWLHILLTTITAFTSTSLTTTYTTLEPWTRWTQTLAAIEVLHAATGITRAPVFTTFTQAFGRCVQVWAINYAFPEVTASSWAYPSMLFAWSVADVVRYLYFVFLLARGSVPDVLKWMRYSLFFGLYPIGIASEWWMMFHAANVTTSALVMGIFYFFLALYVPGSPMMFSYMIKQRRKILARS
ncbi:tyrosine phosphatase-like protein [Aspergillus avenaceus]|uniref:Very-long-chain (3R)-3-hydroxyacyl-CoA dehydratase n=1 Tax=Aspergillus avenaceus TaxID=36643 RepID=A0A5N6TJA6_ASPAV|nr:tyrosine phosphatase-like protein [Aspergillus avenaceus]